MLQLDNKTPYQAERAVLLDLDGSEIWVVAVKATFEVRAGKPVLAGKQEPVCLTDEYHGKPGESGMKYENELVFKKPGTDIIINGHAYTPREKAVTKLDVSARVGKIQKTIRVFGDRVWSDSMNLMTISRPKPFLKMPLIYERAFGGTDLSDDNPKKHGAEHRNPIGAGFGMSAGFLAGKPLPNLEDPANEITGWKDRPEPACFGTKCKHWEPRRRYAGTYDQKWIEDRLPLYPQDFDLRFFFGAHPEMTANPHLKGGEPVELKYLTPNSYLAFELPKISLAFRTRLSGQWVEHRAKIGSVIIEPDVPRIMMVWQTMLPCHRKKFELEETEIREKEFVPLGT